MLHLVSCSPTKLQLKPTLYIIELVHYIQVESPRLHSKREANYTERTSRVGISTSQPRLEYNAHTTSAKATATDFAASRVAGAEDEAPGGGVPLPVDGVSAGQV